MCVPDIARNHLVLECYLGFVWNSDLDWHLHFFIYVFIHLFMQNLQPYILPGSGAWEYVFTQAHPNSRETQIYNHLCGTLIELFRGKRKGIPDPQVWKSKFVKFESIF